MQREVEIMRVSRILPMARLVVGVGDLRLDSLSEVRDPALRGRLLAAVGELIQFAGGYQALVDAGVAPQLTVSPVSAPEKPAAPSKSQVAFLDSLERQTGALRSVAELTRKEKKGAEAETTRDESTVALDLAEQIEAVLQRRLASDPELTGRDIHIMSNPGGGLRIEVDGMLFRAVNEIEDAQVREAIDAARREWEAGG